MLDTDRMVLSFFSDYYSHSNPAWKQPDGFVHLKIFFSGHGVRAAHTARFSGEQACVGVLNPP